MNNLKWIIPLVCVLVLIPFGSWIDMHIAHYYFEYEGGSFHSTSFFDFIYDYGPLPAEGVAIGSVFLLFLRKWRRIGLLLVLMMVVGAGALVHGVLKDHWGRPRPKQVVEFGGKQPFRPFYSPNIFHQIEPSKSFPCGHCSMGFYFLAFVVLGMRYRNRMVFWGGLFLSLILGGVLGWTRIVQGGHFFTDVILSGFVMWMTALVLDWLIWGRENDERTH